MLLLIFCIFALKFKKEKMGNFIKLTLKQYDDKDWDFIDEYFEDN